MKSRRDRKRRIAATKLDAVPPPGASCQTGAIPCRGATSEGSRGFQPTDCRPNAIASRSDALETSRVFVVGVTALPDDHRSVRVVAEIENKSFPTAERSIHDPNRVISPYTGKEILVEGIPPGSLVTDPDFPMEERKYFRVPEASEATAETDE